ncbi:hypothetical protein ABKN59_005093 [Abortiporus biennis]
MQCFFIHPLDCLSVIWTDCQINDCCGSQRVFWVDSMPEPLSSVYPETILLYEPICLKYDKSKVLCNRSRDVLLVWSYEHIIIQSGRG